jgi:hypothetical protein
MRSEAPKRMPSYASECRKSRGPGQMPVCSGLVGGGPLFGYGDRANSAPIRFVNPCECEPL